MKIYLINLDKDVAKFAVADRQLQSFGIEYSRISAIDGKSLSQSEKKSKVSYFRWWCAVGVPPRDGEIGCALSHIAVYKRIVESGLEYACVLEDDVVLDKRFTEVLEQVSRSINSLKPQVLLLSNHSDESENTGSGAHVSGYRSSCDRQFEIKRIRSDSFTEGYVLTCEAAKVLIKQNTPLRIYADAWHRWARRGAIELYHVFPTVCSQDKVSFASATVLCDSTLDVSKMSRLRWLWHKFNRCIGCALDRVLLCLLGK